MSTPTTGYKQTTLLNVIVKDQASKYIKKEASKLVSKQVSKIANKQLSKFANKYDDTLNKAVASARSATEKMAGSVGGRLSASISSAIGNKLGGLGGQLGNVVGSQITNLATGAVSKGVAMATNKLSSALGGQLGNALGGALGSSLGKLSDSAAKNLVNAQLAPGFFSTQPDSQLLTQDAYGVSDNGILNAVGNTVSQALASKMDDLRGSGSGLATDLLGMAIDQSKSWVLSKDGIAGRIVDSLGGRTGVLNNLTSKLQDTLTNGLGLPNSVYDQAKVVIGNAISNIRVESSSDARQVFSMINTITKSSDVAQYFDTGSEATLYAGVIREAVALGVPGAVELLVENAPNNEAVNYALQANIVTAIEYSDLDTVKVLLDKLGANRILAVMPDAVTVLLANYELPIGTAVAGYQSEYDELTALLTRLNANWGTTDRGAAQISNLASFGGMSDDARTLFLRYGSYQVETLIGSSYAESSKLVPLLQQNYPNVPVFT